MPIPFLILGLTIIYLIFYGKDIQHKKTIALFLSVIMIGFFVEDEEVFAGVIVDVFILLPSMILFGIFFNKIKSREWLLLVIMMVVSTIFYLLVVYTNIEFCTLLNPIIIFWITVGLASISFNNIYVISVYTILSYLIYDLINIFYVKSSIGVVTIFGVNTAMLIIYSICISLIVNICSRGIKGYVFKREFKA